MTDPGGAPDPDQPTRGHNPTPPATATTPPATAETPPARSAGRDAKRGARLREANRGQIGWGRIDLDAQVSDDDPVRSIWAVVERLELSVLYAPIEARDEVAGAPVRPAAFAHPWRCPPRPAARPHDDPGPDPAVTTTGRARPADGT